MKVLAISAHPDDVEIACSGTLSKCVQRGDLVTVCHMSNGNLGHMVIPPKELAEIRIEEARSAGALAGIKVICAGFGDLDLYGEERRCRDCLTDIIKKEDPDFIITHDPEDYMPDHVAVSKLTFDASFAATLPNYPNSVKGAARPVPIFYMDTLAGVNFLPEYYVDITSAIDLKLRMLECHQSQLRWMREHDGIDFADMVKVCSRYRGYQCGVGYAEAFRLCKAYLKGTAERLLP